MITSLAPAMGVPGALYREKIDQHMQLSATGPAVRTPRTAPASSLENIGHTGLRCVIALSCQGRFVAMPSGGKADISVAWPEWRE
jgi:hypothetical protein